MSGLIDEGIIDKIRDSVDIVEIVSGYISLKRAGRNFKAACPFHREKTASFMVSPEKQIYHCFGCGEGGNVFNFVMKYERVEFPEAVRLLAQKAGIAIPTSSTRKESKSDTEYLLKVNEEAAAFYHATLIKDNKASCARNYLKNRFLKDETLGKFKIGYAPGGWDNFFKHAISKGIDKAVLEKAGLIIAGKDSFYDRFRDRVIFPIFNIKGQVLGFGGRVLDESLPKYINSPETEVYIKGRNLYGLNFAIDETKKKDFIVIVEGYLDLISLYQAGFKNVVATLGTALTNEQIRLIKRFTNNVVVLFDADQAGELASLRGLDLLLEEDVNVDVAGLPIGYDPDRFVAQYGIESFVDYIKHAKDFFNYKLDVLLSMYDKSDIRQKAKIVSEMLPTMAKVKNNILKSEYIKLLSDRITVDEAVLRTELKNTKSIPYRELDYKESKGKDVFDKERSIRPAEKLVLRLMLEDRSLIRVVKEALDLLDFKDAIVRNITKQLYELSAHDKEIKASKLIGYFDDEFSMKLISELASDKLNLVDKEKNLYDCIKRIKEDNLKERCQLLRDRIKLAETGNDQKSLSELISEYNNLIKCEKM